MAKVLAFPVKKTLPKHVEERLHNFVGMYVKELSSILDELYDGLDDPKECDEMTEIMLETLFMSLISAMPEEES